MHTLISRKQITRCPDGFLLGNGDMSVSCWQQEGKLLFQIGKNDFWDTRMPLENNPRPAHIRELKELLESPNFRVDGVTFKVKADNLTERQKEICRHAPFHDILSPCPKPGPVFCLHYPADWNRTEFEQRLDIERARLTITIANGDGAKLTVECVVHPQENRLTCHWQLEGWTEKNLYGGSSFFGIPDMPPVYATLYREEELPVAEFDRRQYRDHGNHFFQHAKTLPPVVIDLQDGVLSQAVPDGRTLYTTVQGTEITGTESFAKIYRLFADREKTSGSFYLACSTQSREEALALAAGGDWEKDKAEAEAAASRYYGESTVNLPSEMLESVYYATLHAKRCVLRQGVVPPGCFLPSSLNDFSMWKGDYHFNYNYQSNCLGDFEANHFSTGDAFFDGLACTMRLGEKIARDYYGIPDACFIPLCGYPVDSPDDYHGTLPLGRMAYMTGWIAAWFYRRWKLTMDREFLEQKAYPAMKKFANFYAGFLVWGDDGHTHAYPSNQGESEFSHDGAYDQPQVLFNAAFALYAASQAARYLGCDSELADKWENLRAHLPAAALVGPPGMAPEFFSFDGHIPQGMPLFMVPGNRFHGFYLGQSFFKGAIPLHCGDWQKEEWYEPLLDALQRWVRPNGILNGMSLITHGNQGMLTESLGAVALLNSLLMTSDGGTISLFNGIPASQAASFRQLRAEGAFLVSASKKTEVSDVEILSEAGCLCRLRNPWGGASCRLIGQGGESARLEGEVLEFATVPGQTYRLAKW